jgi:hypothetical protein
MVVTGAAAARQRSALSVAEPSQPRPVLGAAAVAGLGAAPAAAPATTAPAATGASGSVRASQAAWSTPAKPSPPLVRPSSSGAWAATSSSASVSRTAIGASPAVMANASASLSATVETSWAARRDQNSRCQPRNRRWVCGSAQHTWAGGPSTNSTISSARRSACLRKSHTHTSRNSRPRPMRTKAWSTRTRRSSRATRVAVSPTLTCQTHRLTAFMVVIA